MTALHRVTKNGICFLYPSAYVNTARAPKSTTKTKKKPTPKRAFTDPGLGDIASFGDDFAAAKLEFLDTHPVWNNGK